MIILLLFLWALLSSGAERHADARESTALVVQLLPLAELVPPVAPERLERPRPVADPGGRPARRNAAVTPLRVHKASAPPERHFEVTPVRLDAPTIPIASAPVGDLDLASLADRMGAGEAGGRDDRGDGTDGSGRGSGHGEGDGRGAADRLVGASWVWKPTERDLAPFAPSSARRRGLSGTVALACRVKRSTLVHECKVTSETPAGLGFGEASLAAARIFRVHPPRINGRLVPDAQVSISIEWAYRSAE